MMTIKEYSDREGLGSVYLDWILQKDLSEQLTHIQISEWREGTNHLKIWGQVSQQRDQQVQKLQGKNELGVLEEPEEGK